jgi:phosphate transport system permease protein
LGPALEPLIEAVVHICGFSAVFFVFAIFWFVFREGADLLVNRLDIRQFFTSIEWYPSSQSNVRYGALALIAGTGSVTVLSMAIAVPFGLGGAIYVSEFCSGRTRETLKVVIELLAAIPSVVWGFIGLMVLNPILRDLFDAPMGLNVLNGALLLALMSVPIMVSIGEAVQNLHFQRVQVHGHVPDANRHDSRPHSPCHDAAAKHSKPSCASVPTNRLYQR